MAQEQNNPSDAALTASIRDGDETAFRDLYYRYAQPLFRFLYRRTHDRETAEDLTQELFARIWKNRANLDPDKPVKAFCYQIANNLAIDHLRRKVADPVSPDAEMPTPATEIDETAFQKRGRIGKALAELPDGQRQVFMLSRFEGLKYQEIAQVLQISVKTVENHMGRALKKLRLNLKDLLHQIFFGPM
ncbi:MAG: RNA polymerase sigma-70 factor [Acidobacteriota bacterium]|nr:RNA polymerase sigma-70 factor [Acidobacteriota bacterium]